MDDVYHLVVERCKAVGITPFCPRCVTDFLPQLKAVEVGWLHPNMAMNPLSRRERQYVCRACGAAESLADRQGGLTDSMARTVVEQDRQEAMRLPPGNFYSASMWPTGGLDRWIEELNDRYTALLRNIDGRLVVEPGQTMTIMGCTVELGIHVIELDVEPEAFWEDVFNACSSDEAEGLPGDPGTGQDQEDQRPLPGDR